MASGKASRRRRQAVRAAPPPPARASRFADRRLWVAVAAAGAILVAVVLGAVLASRGDGGGSGASATGSTLPDAAEVTAVFDGVPQERLALGKPDAPVTLVEFADLQCPYCREFAVGTLPSLVEEQVAEGRLRVELRGLAFLGPDSERGLRAALAASLQDRMWELTEVLYANQGAENDGWLSQELVEAAARSIPGVDVPRLVDDMESETVSSVVERHAAEAAERGVDSTPTLLVGKTGGELTRVELSSPTDLAAIERAIDAAAE